MSVKTTISKEQAIRNGNEGRNQRIKEMLVQREVYCNVNTLVEYIISKGFEDGDAPFTYDDIENFYTYPEYNGKHISFDGGTYDEWQEAIEQEKEERDVMQTYHDGLEADNDENAAEWNRVDKFLEELNAEIEELESLESEPQEIFEWWAISGYLYEKLKELGECVVDAGSCYVWGRGCTGQAILLDHTFTKIAADMEILEGQANEWK